MTNEEILAQVKFFVGFIGAVEVYSHVNTRFLVLGGGVCQSREGILYFEGRTMNWKDCAVNG